VRTYAFFKNYKNDIFLLEFYPKISKLTKMNIALLGFMGAGKTIIGTLLAELMDYQFIDLDRYIENRFKTSVADIFATKGESGFRDFEKTALTQVLRYKNVVVATGGGTPCFFDNIEQINQSATSIYLQFSPEILATRIRLDTTGKRPLVKEQTFEELVEFTRIKLEQRESYYMQAHITVSLPVATPYEIADLLFRKIQTQR